VRAEPGGRSPANGTSSVVETRERIVSLTWILGILLGAALLFALYAGNTRRKP
jgi:hypothetical protein